MTATHLIAPMDPMTVESGDRTVCWLSIDGDIDHGFVVRGLDSPNGPVNFDYWFRTLGEAISTGEDHGVERTAWKPRPVDPGTFPDL